MYLLRSTVSCKEQKGCVKSIQFERDRKTDTITNPGNVED